MQGHVRRRGKRTWAVIVDLDRGPDGKRKQKWHTVQGTKKDAETERTKLLNALETGCYVEPGKLTVGEYLEKWLTEYAKTSVAPTTYQRYQCIVRLHLVKALGQIPLTKLQPLHIQGYYSQALQTGRLDKESKTKGLAARTVGHHHRVLSEALSRAVKWQILARNPADAVDPPRVEDKEVQAIDEAAAAWLIDAAIGTRLYEPIMIALTTGMRRGEVLALRWSDCDLVRGSVTVLRSLEETKEGGLRFKDVKRKRSRRPISLPGILIEALSAHRQEQARHRELYGAEYNDGGLVCCKEDGSVWKPSAFTSAYRELLRRRKIANIPFHNLRHSHASQLLRAGVNPKVISERLGHSKVAFTMDVYAHLFPGMQEEAAGKTDSGLRNALEKQRQHRA